MRRIFRNAPGKWALVMGLAIALAGGVAVAATQSVSTPPSGDFTAVGTFTFDATGGAMELCGGRVSIEEIEWSIGFDDDFSVTCNGEPAGTFLPGVSYTVTVDVYLSGIEWKADSPEAKKVIRFLQEEMQVSKIRFPEHCGIGIKPVSEQGTKRLVRQAMIIVSRLVKELEAGNTPRGLQQNDKGRLYLGRERTLKRELEYLLYRRWLFFPRRNRNQSLQCYF